MKHTLNILQISSSSEIQFEYYYEDTLFNCSYLSLSNRSPKSNCWNSCTLKDIDRNNLKPVLNILHNKICFFSCFIRHRANKIIVWNTNSKFETFHEKTLVQGMKDGACFQKDE